ncbi:uncharacterized protein LOC114533323 [Dendronephthya gigantea]|uniref:uncharacterized protein LOC114533323 n=1 Tax=Dendronephthya gigantea TaxID=151771 RepID=UPI00106C9B46|nr:uncharacterized protein LOC114533323 [Dendronephthya gigantea]
MALDNIFFVKNPCVVQRVGCFKDRKNEVFPKLIGNFRNQIDWNNMDKTVRQCSCAAHEGGYKVFAVQYYGECWGSREMVQYDKYGPSKDCWKEVGKENTNFVYKFA